MTLSSRERKELKAKAHHLNPVVRVGQKGVTENLLMETQQALETHELIKLHIAVDDRDERRTVCEEIAEKTGAELVHTIGKVCILYRQKDAAGSKP